MHQFFNETTQKIGNTQILYYTFLLVLYMLEYFLILYIFFVFTIIVIITVSVLICGQFHTIPEYFSFDEKSKNILDEFKDSKIQNIYINNRKFPNIYIFFIKYVLFFEDKSSFHPKIIFELYKNDELHYITLNKLHKTILKKGNNIRKNDKINKYKFDDKNLGEFIDELIKNIGEFGFFNWTFDNNCHQIEKEVMILLKEPYIEHNYNNINPYIKKTILFILYYYFLLFKNNRFIENFFEYIFE